MRVVGRDGEKVLLRLPAGVREAVKDIAAENRRSMNTQIVLFLEQAVGDRPDATKAAEPRA